MEPKNLIKVCVMVFFATFVLLNSVSVKDLDRENKELKGRLIKLECSQQIIKGTETAGCIGAR